MAREWTPAQKNAISARKGTLLVSAAAGSGKTAVLVQRVIERLTDRESPCDADRLLVVTFTKAAAAEMRERISAAIGDLLEKDPYDVHLQRQQILLERAHISTIHSFCSELVRENFFRLGISPDFRIADAGELTLLREEAMQCAVEELYAGQEEDFTRVFTLFSLGKDDRRMLSAIGTLYDFVRSHPFPSLWLEQKETMYHETGPLAASGWGTVVLRYARSAVEYGVGLVHSVRNQIAGETAIEKAYGEAFAIDEAALCRVRDALYSGDWDTAYAAVHAFTPAKLKPLRGYQEHPVKIRAGECREEIKKTFSKLQKLFLAGEEECREDIRRLAPVVGQMFGAVRCFGEKLDELKAKRHTADFSDLEQWALRLLVRRTQTGVERTEEAEEIAQRFDEVMVDEYQDTNEAQDMIFWAVSKKERNLFFVGDVKQSIYRFRQAMPEIFLRRRAEYPPYDPVRDEYPASVVLDRNFRSRPGVTDAVNFVFRRLMSQETGEMNYTTEEELRAGASYLERQRPDVSLQILDLAESEEDMDTAEARLIARLIAQRIGEGEPVCEGGETRPATYRDFCVLLRNANSHASVYARELQLHGIPSWTDTGGSFFGTPEVSVVLALLRVIDNPVQDIPLIAVLMSPIYGFTPDDLAQIRVLRRRDPIYFALKEAARGQDGPASECRRFLQDIEEYRRLAATLPADQVLERIYEQSGYLAMVRSMRQGDLRLANLRRLLSYARSYERSGYKGLTGFVRFIDRLEEQQADLAPASVLPESANVVRVMSIHRSKGLEFPVCILAGCARQFNKEKDEVLLHPALGPGFCLWDKEGTRRYSTLPREAVALELERAGMSEELRVLYVAMTRAKEDLVLITSLKNPARTLGKLAAQLTGGGALSPFMVRNAQSFSDWLLSCALCHPSGGALRTMAGIDGDFLTEEGLYPWDICVLDPLLEESAEESAEEACAATLDTELLQLIDRRLTFRYPAEALRTVPAKVAASEFAAREERMEFAAATRPAFLSGQRMTAAEKGTALHLFLQYADYRSAREDLEGEITRLTGCGFLSAEQGGAVDRGHVAAFLSSPLMDRMLRSPNLLREYRFTVRIPAGLVCGALPQPLQEETVVLQGAVDCLFEEEGQWIIVDYKTDRIGNSAALQERYAGQLSLYAAAVKACTGKEIRSCLLYSFHTDSCLAMANDAEFVRGDSGSGSGVHGIMEYWE